MAQLTAATTEAAEAERPGLPPEDVGAAESAVERGAGGGAH